MITLEKIISSNLEMLKSQETELLKALEFVQKAKQLFESQNSTPTRKKRRANKAKATPEKLKPGQGAKKGTHLANIMRVLKQKGAPLSSSEIIDTLFKQQKKDKNINHYRQLIYPTLTQAYKKGVLKNKDGKVHLT
jgi:hypothetical protein